MLYDTQTVYLLKSIGVNQNIPISLHINLLISTYTKKSLMNQFEINRSIEVSVEKSLSLPFEINVFYSDMRFDISQNWISIF